MNSAKSIRTAGAAAAGVAGLRQAGWSAVVVLLVAYAVSFLDRQIISLLVDPLKSDLGITDTQVGILQGPAFGIFYALLGLPLGWLADRVHRVRLIAVAIALWSAMTIASGFAASFDMLLLARIGVGIGEAALVPAAVSLLSDLFPIERRALPLSVFTCGISLGLGLALTLGGGFIAFAQGGAAGLPLIGAWLAAQHPWQTAFMLAGCGGLPVAALVLLIHEPRAVTRRAAEPPPPLAAALRYLALHRGFFVPMLLATSSLYVLASALSAWMPALFIRRFGWSAPEVGRSLGMLVMLVGLSGNLASGFVTRALALRGKVDAPLRTMLLGACVMLPAALLAPLLPGADLALAGVLVLYAGIALTFGIATTAFVAVTPPRLRGQVVALYLLIGNLVGLGLGPTSVGALLDAGWGPFAAIGPALALICTAMALLALPLLMRARQVFARVLPADS
jgi:MFS family permease